MIDTYFDKKALTEVDQVLNMLEDKDLAKIPNKIIETIRTNKDNTYELDMQKLERGEMLEDTQKILGTIYSYYLASEDEKDVIFKLIKIKSNVNRKNRTIYIIERSLRGYK